MEENQHAHLTQSYPGNTLEQRQAIRSQASSKAKPRLVDTNEAAIERKIRDLA